MDASGGTPANAFLPRLERLREPSFPHSPTNTRQGFSRTRASRERPLAQANAKPYAQPSALYSLLLTLYYLL